jgi:hypothetical protein
MTEQRRSAGPARAETRESRDPNAIEPGYFAYRWGKGRPEIAARIWRACHCTVIGGERNEEHEWCSDCDRFPRLVADVDGRRYEETTDWHNNRPPVLLQVWTFGRRIAAEQYELMLDQAAWDRMYDPSSPLANPEKPIDLNTMKSIF